MEKQSILVSRCLLGVPCRYHGRPTVYHSRIKALLKTGKYEIVDVCPEVDGGLPVPRPATRDHGGVLVCDGEDVTAQFVCGAEIALAVANSRGVEKAYLVNGSPSCDKFKGVAAKLLQENGIKVISV